ncbi:hypothetical protein PVAG01_02295 [Phlyctema vagabunda]|uniref:Uncharacterized protein n=1 Tax=Phlyctema vagabunda TaxID=108571 RepID=A0ABR4PQ53_9HELO
MRFTSVLTILALSLTVHAAPVAEEARNDAQNFGSYGGWSGGGYGSFVAVPLVPIVARPKDFETHPLKALEDSSPGFSKRALEYVKSLWA